MMERVIEQGLNRNHMGSRGNGGISYDEYLLLKHIAGNQDQAITKLMEDLNLDRGYFHSSLHKLLKGKWVEKHQHAEDRRLVLIRPTDRGKAVLEAEVAQFEEALAYFLKDLTVNEERAVLKFISKLHQWIRKDPEGGR
jgi:MarR family transcriptional regulator, organic hydroperoxide resistance regulator